MLRWSEELRRGGELPRECILRKSWLDEPFGAKLEECLNNFAEHVIRSIASKMDVPTETLVSPAQYALESYLSNSHLKKLLQLQARISAPLLTYNACTRNPSFVTEQILSANNPKNCPRQRETIPISNLNLAPTADTPINAAFF